VSKHGGSRGRKRAAKVKSRQRRLAHEEVRREEHARLVIERAGDPRFVQRRVAEDGSVTLRWDNATLARRELRTALEGQLEAFRQKFGREPGPDDPVFFDPDADASTPSSQGHVASMFDDLVDAAEQAGVDPAKMKASRDLGYIVTTENQHLFSAVEIQAWQDAVERHHADVDDLDDDVDLEDLLDLLAVELRTVVERTVVQRSAEPARVFAERVMETDLAVAEGVDEDGEGVSGLSVAFAILAGWLSVAREDHVDSQVADKVVAWVRSSLGSRCRSTPPSRSYASWPRPIGCWARARTSPMSAGSCRSASRPTIGGVTSSAV
jgi:hypothetical protein